MKIKQKVIKTRIKKSLKYINIFIFEGVTRSQKEKEK